MWLAARFACATKKLQPNSEGQQAQCGFVISGKESQYSSSDHLVRVHLTISCAHVIPSTSYRDCKSRLHVLRFPLRLHARSARISPARSSQESTAMFDLEVMVLTCCSVSSPTAVLFCSTVESSQTSFCKLCRCLCGPQVHEAHSPLASYAQWCKSLSRTQLRTASLAHPGSMSELQVSICFINASVLHPLSTGLQNCHCSI